MEAQQPSNKVSQEFIRMLSPQKAPLAPQNAPLPQQKAQAPAVEPKKVCCKHQHYQQHCNQNPHYRPKPQQYYKPCKECKTSICATPDEVRTIKESVDDWSCRAENEAMAIIKAGSPTESYDCAEEKRDFLTTSHELTETAYTAAQQAYDEMNSYEMTYIVTFTMINRWSQDSSCLIAKDADKEKDFLVDNEQDKYLSHSSATFGAVRSSKSMASICTLILIAGVGFAVAFGIISILLIPFPGFFVGIIHWSASGQAGSTPVVINVLMENYPSSTGSSHQEDSIITGISAAQDRFLSLHSGQHMVINWVRVQHVKNNRLLSGLAPASLAPSTAGGITVVVDLRLDRSMDIPSLMNETNNEKLLVVKPFPQTDEDTISAIHHISTSGPERAHFAALISKFAEINSLKQSSDHVHVLPIVATNSKHYSDSAETFSHETSRLFPKAKFLPFLRIDSEPEVFSHRLRTVLKHFPEANPVLFADGNQVRSIFGAMQGNEGFFDRIWFYPEAIYWEEELQRDHVAWKNMKRVGMMTVAFLSDGHNSPLRRKEMQKMQRNISHSGSLFLSTLAYDAVFKAAEIVEKQNEFMASSKTSGNVKIILDNQMNRFGGKFARLTLLPEIGSKDSAKLVDILQQQEWLVDAVFRLEKSQIPNDTRQDSVEIVDSQVEELTLSRILDEGVGTGHFLQREHFGKFFNSSFDSCGKTYPTVTVSAFDPFSYAKITRTYNFSSFPELIIFPSDHGYSIEIEGVKNEGCEKFVHHLVCPAVDDVLGKLPCIHALTAGKSEDFAVSKRIRRGISTVSRNPIQFSAEIDHRDAPRYFEILSDTNLGSDPKDYKSWTGLFPNSDVPFYYRQVRGVETPGRGGIDASSSPALSTDVESIHDDGESWKSDEDISNEEHDLNSRDHSAVVGVTKGEEPLPDLGSLSGDIERSAGVEETWDPELVKDLSGSFKITEEEVKHILHYSEPSFIPSLERKDAIPAPAKQKYPMPKHLIILNSALPAMGGCIGAATMCIFCSLLSEGVGSSSVPCIGTCHASTWANCLGMLGLLYNKVYKENSKTLNHHHHELMQFPFSHSYVADSQFGLRLATKDPFAISGYHILANPVVWAMQKSPLISDLVETLTQPWVTQMAFEEGYSASGSPMGAAMMRLGIPLCSALGWLVQYSSCIWIPEILVMAASLLALKQFRSIC
ncbi:unnamed protein product, partial [Notodromas monacha]